MNRRGFLNFVGAGIAVAAVAPHALLTTPAPIVADYNFALAEPIVIGSYANYTNFSEFALKAATDETVENCARQLADELAERMSNGVYI